MLVYILVRKLIFAIFCVKSCKKFLKNCAKFGFFLTQMRRKMFIFSPTKRVNYMSNKRVLLTLNYYTEMV